MMNQAKGFMVTLPLLSGLSKPVAGYSQINARWPSVYRLARQG
jgi:hypothetical protein